MPAAPVAEGLLAATRTRENISVRTGKKLDYGRQIAKGFKLRETSTDGLGSHRVSTRAVSQVHVVTTIGHSNRSRRT